jgi:hypothetical protein
MTTKKNAKNTTVAAPTLTLREIANAAIATAAAEKALADEKAVAAKAALDAADAADAKNLADAREAFAALEINNAERLADIKTAIEKTTTDFFAVQLTTHGLTADSIRGKSTPTKKVISVAEHTIQVGDKTVGYVITAPGIVRICGLGKPSVDTRRALAAIGLRIKPSSRKTASAMEAVTESAVMKASEEIAA